MHFHQEQQLLLLLVASGEKPDGRIKCPVRLVNPQAFKMRPSGLIFMKPPISIGLRRFWGYKGMPSSRIIWTKLYWLAAGCPLTLVVVAKISLKKVSCHYQKN
jgi:hypothetical protein